MRSLVVMMAMLVYGVLVFGQNTIGLPLIRNFSKLDFKGGSQTWDIDQDSVGRMYFANNEGLLTYDGSFWNLYPLPNKTIMRSVTLGSKGRIYVGGQGEAGYFAPDGKGFLKYHSLLELIPKEQRDFADIWDIEIRNESVFFRATDRILELTNNSVRTYRPVNEWLFLKSIGNMVLAQDSRQGLFQFSNGQWMPLKNGELVGSDAIQGSTVVGKDSILIATYMNNLYLLTPQGLSRHTGLGDIVNGHIFSMEGLNPSEFVVGTTNAGCLVLGKNGELVQRLSTAEGLQDNSVLCSFTDKDGNLWVGLNHGISLIAYNAAVKYIRPDKGNELSGYSTRVFGNNIYISTSNGAYAIPIVQSKKDLSFIKAGFNFVPGSGGIAYRLDEVNQQLLMAHNEGTFVIRNGAAQKLTDEPSWLFVPLSAVFPSAKVLVGNYTGFKLLNYQNNNFTATPNLSGLRESFRFIAIDNDQQIWASHPYRGIFQVQLDEASGKYTTKLFTARDGLPSDLDNHVFRIKNRVVFATDAGVYEFEKASRRFVPSSFLTPVLGKTPVRYLQEDEDGNIWFVTGKKLGVLVYNASSTPNYTVTYFPEVAGQILSGFENVYPFNRQNIFVGSERGVILINLEKYLLSRRTPSLMLSGVHAINQSDTLISDGFNTQTDGGAPGVIKLPYSLNSIRFEYSSPAYGFQENIEYSYKLEGFDEDWSKWSSRTEKDYTSLHNGDYVFKVRARSNLGSETEMILYRFTIAAPWYKSGFAYAFYFLLLLGGLWLLRYFHRQRLRRQRVKYEEKQEQLRVLHQLEMEKNEKEIMRLQNEKLANEVNYKNKELAESTMHLVERSDAMAKVKEELQRLYKTNPVNQDIKRAINLLNEIERNNADWDRFAASFDEINNDFLKKLKAQFPALTNNDLKLCAYLQLKMSTKEISQLLNISTRGVEISRYRLRKKLGITSEITIGDFLASAISKDA